MVVYVKRFDILPDKVEAYTEWIKNYLPLTLAVRGAEELRAYRTAVSSKGHIVALYHFKDLEAWAEWFSNTELKKFLNELSKYITNETSELWEPSPIVPEPIKAKSNL